jgi:DNA invertase Pin-like site-specific DNA recombinase
LTQTLHRYAPIRGENNRNSKLRELDVLEIRRMLKEGVNHREIARMFGVSKQTISGIKTGDRWNWLKGGEGAQ